MDLKDAADRTARARRPAHRPARCPALALPRRPLLPRSSDAARRDDQTASKKTKKRKQVLELAKSLLEKLPANDPAQFGRRLGLQQILGMLDAVLFEQA